MRTLTFTISGQHITGSAISDLVGNTRDYVQASFSFSSEWDDLLKVAIFTANSKQYPVVIESGSCKVPAIVMTGDSFTVGVYGGAESERLTTDTCTIRVEESVRQKPPFDMISMYKDFVEHSGLLVTDSTGVHGFRINLDGKGAYYDPDTESWTVLTGLIDVDSELSDESTNPVQNMVIKAALDILTTAVGLNTQHRSGSINSAGGSHDLRIDQSTHKAQYYDSTTEDWVDVTGLVDVDSALSDSSTNPVQNQVVKAALDILNAAVALNTTHRGTVVTDTNGSHGIRIDATTKKTQYYDSTAEEWKDGGGYIDVDSALSDSSTNPVQNKKVKDAIDDHEVKSVNDQAGVRQFRVNQTTHIPQYYDEAQGVWENVEGTGGGGSTITVDDQFSATSHNPVENQLITNRLKTNDVAVGANTTHRGAAVTDPAGVHGIRYDSTNDVLLVNVSGTEVEVGGGLGLSVDSSGYVIQTIDE